MKRKYRLEAGFDIAVEVEVDHEKLTPELAKEINEFWSGAAEVLSVSNGDHVQAAIRRAGSRLMGAVLSGCNLAGAQYELDEGEGWPPNGEHGIRLTHYETADINPDELTLTVA